MAAVELSKTLIIIIAVSGPVGCIALLFLIFRCLHRSRSAPLPPIQPLAYQRERETKCVSYPFLRRSMASDQAGSYESEKSSEPPPLPSCRTDESSGAPSSTFHFLPPPPPPKVNTVSWPGTRSVESGSDEQPPSLGETRPRQRSRKNSIQLTPSASTHVSTRSSSHGAPHSRYSQVQVVLPIPLAPRLEYHMVADSPTIEKKGGVVGISDRWMTAPNRSTSWRAKSDQSLTDTSPERDFRLLSSWDQNHLTSPPRRQTRSLRVREIPRHPHGPPMIKHDSPALPPRTLMMGNDLGKGYGPVGQWSTHALGPGRYYNPHQPPSNTPMPPFLQSASH